MNNYHINVVINVVIAGNPMTAYLPSLEIITSSRVATLGFLICMLGSLRIEISSQDFFPFENLENTVSFVIFDSGRGLKQHQ